VQEFDWLAVEADGSEVTDTSIECHVESLCRSLQRTVETLLENCSINCSVRQRNQNEPRSHEEHEESRR